MIFLASTYSTTPSKSHTTEQPESRAIAASTPVPTIGASVIISGTACLCMFAPINVRFASSCSINGIILVVTDTICDGETSI